MIKRTHSESAGTHPEWLRVSFCQSHWIVIESAVSYLATIAWLWTNLSLKGLLAVLQQKKPAQSLSLQRAKTKRWTEKQSFSLFLLYILSLAPSVLASLVFLPLPKTEMFSSHPLTGHSEEVQLFAVALHKLINHVWLDYLITRINSQSWVKQTSFS